MVYSFFLSFRVLCGNFFVMQEEVLKQVQETGLFKHVASFLSNSCGRQSPTSGFVDTLPDIAATVCCQGADILGGKLSSSAVYCCRETCLKGWKAEDGKPITMVCGTVVNGNTEQGVDVLIPSSPRKLCCNCSSPSQYFRMHPASTDVLTVLLLSLPSTTWAGIKDEQLLREIDDLVSIENLPTLLLEEVAIFHSFFKNNLLLSFFSFPPISLVNIIFGYHRSFNNCSHYLILMLKV